LDLGETEGFGVHPAQSASPCSLRIDGFAGRIRFIGMYAERQYPLDLHSKRANIVFCDGHAQSLKRASLVSQLNTGGTATWPNEPNRLWNIDNKVH